MDERIARPLNRRDWSRVFSVGILELVSTATILIVDDEALVRWSLRERLSKDTSSLLKPGTGAQAMAQLTPEVDLVLLDFLADDDGISLLRRIKEQSPETLVILMTRFLSGRERGRGDEARRSITSISRSISMRWRCSSSRPSRPVQLRRKSGAPHEPEPEYGFDAVIGESPVMQQVKGLLARVASSRASTVLLTGETGTGKDLAAKAIHYNSDRAARLSSTSPVRRFPAAPRERAVQARTRRSLHRARQQA